MAYFLEKMRALKTRGLFYLNVPSNGDFHRFPVDCWRFYPNSGRALTTWAKRNNINATILKSYLSTQSGGHFNDFVSVFLKDEQYIADFPKRILNNKTDFTNGWLHDSSDFINSSLLPEDKMKLVTVSAIIPG